MKKIFFIAVLAAVGIQAAAQQGLKDSIKNTYRNEVLLRPLSFFVGGFEVGYGRITKNNKGNFRLLAGYFFSENAITYDGRFDEASNMEGFKVEAQYLGTRPVDGGTRYYAGGYSYFKTISLDIKDNLRSYTANGSALGLGIILGIKSYAVDNFFLDFYLGGGPNISLAHTYEDDVDISVLNPYKRAIVPRAGLTVGLSF